MYKRIIEKINKRDMVNIVLSLQSKLDERNKHVLEEICKLSDAIFKVQSELSVSRQLHSLSSNGLTSIKRQCWENARYSRRECLDVIGIPSEVGADVLEEKVLNIFGKLDCDVPPERVKACNRISKKSSTVILNSQKGPS